MRLPPLYRGNLAPRTRLKPARPTFSSLGPSSRPPLGRRVSWRHDDSPDICSGELCFEANLVSRPRLAASGPTWRSRWADAQAEKADSQEAASYVRLLPSSSIMATATVTTATPVGVEKKTFQAKIPDSYKHKNENAAANAQEVRVTIMSAELWGTDVVRCRASKSLSRLTNTPTCSRRARSPMSCARSSLRTALLSSRVPSPASVRSSTARTGSSGSRTSRWALTETTSLYVHAPSRHCSR